MPNMNYLLVHETGKSSTADGAKTLDVTQFSTISYSGNTISFGAYSGSEAEGSAIQNQTYAVDDSSTAGFYHLYDETAGMWFFYMPSLNYLLIHETGKSSASDGATIYDTVENEIDVSYSGNVVTFAAAETCASATDPFGNPIGDGSCDTAYDEDKCYDPFGNETECKENADYSNYSSVASSTNCQVLNPITGECLDNTFQNSSYSYSSSGNDGNGHGHQAPGSACGFGKVYDCDLKCVWAQTAFGYVNDGYCDDGSYGYQLQCAAFDNDGNDCGGNCGTDSSGNPLSCNDIGYTETCYDVFGSPYPCYDTTNGNSTAGETCANGMVFDCNMDCVDEELVDDWKGDGYCDSYGTPNLYCDAFGMDDGDCDNSACSTVNPLTGECMDDDSYDDYTYAEWCYDEGGYISSDGGCYFDDASNSSSTTTDGDYQTIAGIKFLTEEPDGYFGWEDAKEWCEDKGGRLPHKSELLAVWNDNGGQPSPYGFQKDTFYWAMEEADCGYESDTGCHHACAMDAWCSEDASWPDDSYGHPKCVMESNTASTASGTSNTVTSACSDFYVGEASISLTVGAPYWINVYNYCDGLSITSDNEEIATAEWYVHSNGFKELQVDAHHNGSTTIKINDANGNIIASVAVNASWSSTANY